MCGRGHIYLHMVYDRHLMKFESFLVLLLMKYEHTYFYGLSCLDKEGSLYCVGGGRWTRQGLLTLHSTIDTTEAIPLLYTVDSLDIFIEGIYSFQSENIS